MNYVSNCNTEVDVADGKRIKSYNKRCIENKVDSKSAINGIDVLYVPDSSIHFLSVLRIQLHDNKIIIGDEGYSIVNGDVFYYPNSIIATGNLRDGMCRLNIEKRDVLFNSISTYQ